MKVFRMNEDSIPPTMSTPPVNQVPVFQFYNTERIGLPPSLYQTLHLVSGSIQGCNFRQQETFYQCLLYQGLQFNAMVGVMRYPIHDTRDTAPWYQEVLSLATSSAY